MTAVANHGGECLEILEENAFDIILMDLFMPVMDGLEATSEIRKREEAGYYHGRTPIIAVTGNARTEYIDKGMAPAEQSNFEASAVGVDAFIVKPYEKQDLIEKILMLVGQA